jgi:hypothetical protein
MSVTPRQLRESAATLSSETTHELPAMVEFCSRLRQELLDAADLIEILRADREGVLETMQKYSVVCPKSGEPIPLDAFSCCQWDDTYFVWCFDCQVWHQAFLNKHSSSNSTVRVGSCSP